MFRTEVDVVEIAWDGPYTPEQITSGMHRPIDYGVYQIYGTHNILGSDTLLYIGRAVDRPFGVRMGEHSEEWIKWEPSNVHVYLGRIGGVDAMKKRRWEEWDDQISKAEKLLIYFCSPLYNSGGIRSLAEMPLTLILNLKRKHRLPVDISNVSTKTCCGEPRLCEYGTEQMETQAPTSV